MSLSSPQAYCREYYEPGFNQGERDLFKHVCILCLVAMVHCKHRLQRIAPATESFCRAALPSSRPRLLVFYDHDLYSVTPALLRRSYYFFSRLYPQPVIHPVRPASLTTRTAPAALLAPPCIMGNVFPSVQVNTT